MKFLILIIFAYLLGSVPFALIIARVHGKDLAKIGSGNFGATNLSRALNKKWAYFCFLLDVAKGFIPTFMAVNLIEPPHTPLHLTLVLTVGIAALIGHIFSIYINFKGGKGVATSLGLALGLYPYLTICAAFAFAVWLIAVLITRYISLSSVIASISFPLCLITAIIINEQWQFENLWPLLAASVIIPAMVIYRHRSNLIRIRQGTESKIFQKNL